MDITTFLAQLWGPVILAVAVGVYGSRAHYTKIYRDIEKSPLAVLTFGMLAMTLGTAHVLFHNVWDTVPQGFVSFLGWALLAKGTLFIIAPKLVDKAGDAWSNLKLIPVAGALTLIGGGYLTWLGYFA